jgi:HlyD family secretion protein
MPFDRFAPRALAALLATTALVACGREPARAPAATRSTPLVEAVAARFGAVPLEETLPGTVRARNQVEIRPEVEARVVAVLVRGGEAVVRGQELVRLDAAEARERLHQAEADVRLAEAAAAAARARAAEIETRLTRARSLAADGLLSAQELDTLAAQRTALAASADEAAARVELSRAAAEERRSALAKTVVRAPVSGRLGERRVEVGMQVDPSTLLFLVGDLDELIVEVHLSEEMLRHVAAGQRAQIVQREPGAEPIDAVLARISPFLAADSFTTVGELDVDNRDGRLRPGMFVSVRILVGESGRATLVPRTAVWEEPDSGALGVFVVEDAAGLAEPALGTVDADETPRRVVFRPVELVAEGRGVAGVRGLAEGEWAVTLGQQMLAAARPAMGPEGGEAEPTMARVRPVAWQRVLELQDLQNEDLLADFLDKQRKVAAELGAEIPESEDVVRRVLEEAAAAERTAKGGG